MVWEPNSMRFDGVDEYAYFEFNRTWAALDGEQSQSLRSIALAPWCFTHVAKTSRFGMPLRASIVSRFADNPLGTQSPDLKLRFELEVWASGAGERLASAEERRVTTHVRPQSSCARREMVHLLTQGWSCPRRRNIPGNTVGSVLIP